VGHDYEEQDAFTPWRKYLHWQRGELRKIKRRAAKRMRREGRQEAEEGRGGDGAAS
jgi:hypothetical protein